MGCYEIFTEVISENLKETNEHLINEDYFRSLESEIEKEREKWLWLHLRRKIAPKTSIR